MATPVDTGLTYEDLQRFPDDHLRREIIDGELFVTAAPALRHQAVVAELTGLLLAYAKEHGGRVYPAPADVFFADDSVVEPDVVFVRADHLDRLEERLVRGAPDLIVEVSSPTTRRVDLTRKRDLYERYGVPEYWFVDLDADRVEVLRLAQDGRYREPEIAMAEDTVVSRSLSGFEAAVTDILSVRPTDDT